jgi:hypothetical protein
MRAPRPSTPGACGLPPLPDRWGAVPEAAGGWAAAIGLELLLLFVCSLIEISPARQIVLQSS